MKTYLISEETLREVLDALEATQPYLHLECTAQRLVDITENRISNILASPPAEPVAWMIHDRVTSDRLTFNTVAETLQTEVTPLYRKDL
jgi:hypothetical protein